MTLRHPDGRIITVTETPVRNVPLVDVDGERADVVMVHLYRDGGTRELQVEFAGELHELVLGNRIRVEQADQRYALDGIDLEFVEA